MLRVRFGLGVRSSFRSGVLGFCIDWFFFEVVLLVFGFCFGVIFFAALLLVRVFSNGVFRSI